MYFAIWALIVGALLITMALSGTWLRRLPVSTAMLYLAAGFGLGPAGLALMAPDPLTYSGILERAAEVAVLISLFDLSLSRWQCRSRPWPRSSRWASARSPSRGVGARRDAGLRAFNAAADAGSRQPGERYPQCQESPAFRQGFSSACDLLAPQTRGNRCEPRIAA